MRFIRILVAVVIVAGLAYGGYWVWQHKISNSPAAVAERQKETREAAQKKLQALRKEMMDAMREAGKKSPEERRTAWKTWEKEHGEEMRALQQQIVANRSSHPSPSLSPAPANLTEAQIEQRKKLMELHRQVSELSRQPASAERDRKIADLRTEVRALRAQLRQVAGGPVREVSTVSTDPRQVERFRLMKQRSDLLLSLREAEPAKRKAALDKWDQENSGKLKELSEPKAASPVPVKPSPPVSAGSTNR